jgi:CheY-like chemotaxis protein
MNKSAAHTIVSGPQPLILIADDNPANQTTYGDYLTARGYRVLVTSNGPETIARAREARPNLILINVQLPEIDGLEVTQRLRADSRGAAIPIIAITALAIPGDRERCLSAGMDDYLTKPVSLKLLTKKIETFLSKGKIE